MFTYVNTMYILPYIHTYICTLHTCICTYVDTDTKTSTYNYMHIYIYACIQAFIQNYTYSIYTQLEYIHRCICIATQRYTRVYIYIVHICKSFMYILCNIGLDLNSFIRKQPLCFCELCVYLSRYL